ncbi:MAG TPA: uroporphyrinogen decarboxylase family protein [Planctomycetota bacterium]|jgi:uroporphyrinogen decarboxylase
MAELTSRERVRRTLARQMPDRVPVNFAANPGIERRLKAHFDLKEDDTEALLRALGVDFRGIGAPYVGPKLHPDVPDRSVDMWGIHRRWIEHESGGYWDYCDFPLREATLQEVEAWPLPSPDHFDYSAIPDQCARHGDHAIYAGHPGTGDVINQTSMLRTMEQFLVDLITDEPAGLRLVERRIEIQLEIISRTLKAAKGRVDFLWIGEDLGTQIGPMISLELFRRHIRPRHQLFVDLARRWDIPVMIHSCGSSSWAFDDFVEMGIAAVDTLQPEAKNMAPAFLKKQYGGKLVFHGCISTAGPVALGTVDNTISCVRDTLKIMMPGGGYVLAPTHCLQDNSPTANVLAMYDAARRLGRYE